MSFAFPLFLANGILFKSEPRGNEQVSKIRSLPRKMDSCKHNRTVRKKHVATFDLKTPKEGTRYENQNAYKLVREY